MYVYIYVMFRKKILLVLALLLVGVSLRADDTADPIEKLNKKIKELEEKVVKLEKAKLHFVSISNGSSTANETENTTNYNNNTAEGAYNIAIGDRARIISKNEQGSIALGWGSKVEKSDRAIAIGSGANILEGSDQSIAIGNGSSVSKENSIAIGTSGVLTKGSQSLAIGAAEVVTEGKNSISIGSYDVKAVSDQSLAIGTLFVKTLGSNSVALGSAKIESSGKSSVAIGAVGVNSKGDFSLAIGTNGTAANGNYSIVIGSGSKSDSLGGISIGLQAKTGNNNLSTAIGYEANAEGESSISFGSKSNAKMKNTIAIGPLTKANKEYSFVIGVKSESNSESGLVIGENALIRENANYSIAIGIGAYVGKPIKKPDVSPIFDTGVVGTHTVIRGTYLTNNPQESVKYEHSTALGPHARAYGYQTMAIGAASESYGVSSIAIGNVSKAYGDLSMAIGVNSSSVGINSISLGNSSEAIKDESVSIGKYSVSNSLGGIAIGSNSLSNIESDVLGYNPNDKDFNKEKVLGSNLEKFNTLGKEIEDLKVTKSTLYNQFLEIVKKIDDKTVTEEEKKTLELEKIEKDKQLTEKDNEINKRKIEINKLMSSWVSTSGAFSVGNSINNVTRQIINVSAGTLDTDAVNVGQLKNITLNVIAGGEDRKIKLSEDKLKFIGENGITTKFDKEGNVRIGLSLKGKGDVVVTEESSNGTTSNSENKPDVINPTITQPNNSNTGASISQPVINQITKVVDLSKEVKDKIAKIDGLEEKINELKSNSETDTRIRSIENKSYSGIASAIAMANMPTYSSVINGYELNIAYGNYMNAHSIAFGMSGKYNKVSYKISGGINNKGNVSFGLGLGFRLSKNNVFDNQVLQNTDRKRIFELENKLSSLEKEYKDLIEKVKKLYK